MEGRPEFSTALKAIKPGPEAADFIVFMVKRNKILFPDTRQTSIQSEPVHFNPAATKWLYFGGETKGRLVSLYGWKPKHFASKLTFRFVARLVTSQTASSFLAGL